MPRRQILKRTISSVVVLLVAGLGLLGIGVTLFPPHGTPTSTLDTLLGLIFAGVFLFIAWLIWRWSRSCLLRETCPTRQRHKPHD